ncbi:hypothetical protein SARC_07219 [Sphaeroforma arctica JP610]|uniref:Uncharacterized protein n=1 Tax=Sphaeroforma arctica JP610 TaxID=667725 RepID=A0A0L0FUB0_9EUKA|nr:hypothetical protein SARC_07219 [Sphaeroforma arctica JP610]KNC80412.1 hypothetical protein SARC_07219 [Sphaeroforma arctica JP610]|eukprot:XP_014154314.1 hypothetical protein SARC_07219 [Sphaeroforma arctica JP610]
MPMNLCNVSLNLQPSPPNITAMLQIAKGDNLYALIEDARTTLKGAPATGKDRMANEMLKAIYQNGRSSERLFEGIRCMIELGIEFRFYHLNGIAMFIKHNDRKARPDHDFIPNLIAVMKEAPPTELVDKKIANWQLTHKRALSRDRAENEAIRKANALAEANMKARDRFVEKTARVSTSVLPDASASEGQDSRAGVSEGVEGTTRPKRSREVKVIHWEI